MRYQILLQGGLAIIFLSVTLAVAAVPPGGQSKSKSIPPFAEVQRTVLRYFETRPDFRAGDLITRDDVEPLLKQLERKGFPLADAKQILEKVSMKGEFLVDQLSTPGGRQFMRRISGYPEAYDRLDRLGRSPYGQQTIRDLIRWPGGEKIVEYMTTTMGGKELGKQLSNTQSGKHFSDPTSRIYTVALLLERLQQSHAAALKAAK